MKSIWIESTCFVKLILVNEAEANNFVNVSKTISCEFSNFAIKFDLNFVFQFSNFKLFKSEISNFDDRCSMLELWSSIFIFRFSVFEFRFRCWIWISNFQNSGFKVQQPKSCILVHLSLHECVSRRSTNIYIRYSADLRKMSSFC